MRITIYNGQKIYTSDYNDPENDSHCWFSNPDGNSPDCRFIMNNREFREKEKKGMVKEIKDQLTLF